MGCNNSQFHEKQLTSSLSDRLIDEKYLKLQTDNMKFLKKFLLLSVLTLFVMPVFSKSGYNVYSPSDTDKIPNDTVYDKILFIVDLSNSMNEYIGNKKKTEIAFNAFASVLSKISPQTQTGLRVYGHKFGFNPMLGCSATELVSPLKENNTYNIYNILSGMNASGWTPITKSLKKAVYSDFAGVQGQKRIILLTDGGENCDESPCDFAIKLVQTRDDIRIDIIEFALDDEVAEEQLKCTALATSGKIYKANDAESLAKSFEQALNVTTDVQGTIIKK